MQPIAIVNEHGHTFDQRVEVEGAGRDVAFRFAARDGNNNADYAHALRRVLDVAGRHKGLLEAATVESAPALRDTPEPADRNIQTTQRKPIALAGIDLESLRKELTSQREFGGGDGTRNQVAAGAWKRAQFVFSFPTPQLRAAVVAELQGSQPEAPIATGDRVDPTDPPASAPEGMLTQVVVNRYERDPRNRAAAIAHHGTRCAVCNLSFDDRYGEIGDGFIHVHHTTPVSELAGTGSHEVDPLRDLVPVCPNCHAMLHRGRGATPRTVDELRELLR